MYPFSSDRLFMAQDFPSSVGAVAVREAYDAVFNAITLTVKFNVAEIHQIAPEWAIARTNSAGTVKVKTTGGGGPEDKQSLFLVGKNDGTWENAGYCFSTHHPTAPLRS